MITRDQWRKFLDNPIVEWAMFVAGVLLLILAVVSGPLIPGPNGVIFGAAGLSLILKSSLWAKRHYARLKHKSVKIRGKRIVFGEWADWALRRRSAKRREALRKAEEQQALKGDSSVVEVPHDPSLEERLGR